MTRKKKQKAYLDKYNTEIQFVRSEYRYVEKVNAKLVIE